MKNVSTGIWVGRAICVAVLLGTVLSPSFSGQGSVVAAEQVQNFKMISTLEYVGKGQFRNQVETIFTVKSQALANNTTQYRLSAQGFALVGNDPQQALELVIDKKTRRLSGAGQDLALLERVNNECVKSLRKVTKEDAGKEWKRTFKLRFLRKLLPPELTFTVKAMSIDTKNLGETLAVRAVSEPFIIKSAKKGGGIGFIQCKVGAVYLFSADMDDVLMSISVFQAATKINGFKEGLRHEVATYQTDATGKSVDLNGLGKNFEKLVRGVGLAKGTLKVAKETPLPKWVQADALGLIQVANTCAALASEGGPNPVLLNAAASARTVDLQSSAKLATAAKVASVSDSLGKNIPGAESLSLASAPTSVLKAVGLIGGAIAGGGGIYAGVSGGGSSSAVSPVSP